MFRERSRGFSLVELLVVMAIIGLLTTIASVSVSSARGKARDAKRLADVKQIAGSLEGFYADKGGYPIVGGPRSLGEGTYKTICGDDSAADAGFPSVCAGIVYMPIIPAYPVPGPSDGEACGTTAGTKGIVHYCYNSYDSGGSLLTNWSAAVKVAYTYQIFFGLEGSNDTLGGSVCTITPNGMACIPAS